MLNSVLNGRAPSLTSEGKRSLEQAIHWREMQYRCAEKLAELCERMAEDQQGIHHQDATPYGVVDESPW